LFQLALFELEAIQLELTKPENILIRIVAVRNVQKTFILAALGLKRVFEIMKLKLFNQIELMEPSASTQINIYFY